MKAARQEMELMAFAPIETRAPNPDAWLVHPLLWLQPELALSPPPPSALRLTRRHEPPPPTFAPLLTSAQAGSSHLLWGGLPSPGGTSTSRFPESGLIPLGWDPRALI